LWSQGIGGMENWGIGVLSLWSISVVGHQDIRALSYLGIHYEGILRCKYLQDPERFLRTLYNLL